MTSVAVLAALVALQQGVVIRGELVMADSMTRAPGVLVEARNSTGALAGRGISDARGAFALSVPSAGPYELRALRVGFRPTIASAVAGDANARTRIVLNSAVVSLAAVKVSADDQCRVKADSGQLVAKAWEMARTALATTGASESSRRITAAGLVYQSWREESGDGQLWQTFHINEALTARPFVSAPPDQLAKSGYSVKTGPEGGVEFVGPEPEALISDDFAATHCFHVAKPDARYAEAIGVDFRPLRERPNIVDIAGTFWVDRASGELRVLEFRYTNVPVDLERAKAGGRIEYRRLGTGDWVVNRWHIRLPTVIEHNYVTRSAGGGGNMQLIKTKDEGAMWTSVTGGELLEAVSDSGEEYAGKGLAWRAQVASAGKPTPPGITAELPSVGYFGAADSTGAILIDQVQPGAYDALFSSAPMRALGVPPVKKRVTIAAGAAPEMFALPGDDELLRRRCGNYAVARNQAAIFGIATGPDGRPLASDSMWVRRLAEPEASARGRLERSSADVVNTDPLGRWVVCGIPRNAKVMISRVETPVRPDDSVVASIPRDARVVEVETLWGKRP